jgi:hypothetical protein
VILSLVALERGRWLPGGQAAAARASDAPR